MKIGFTIAFTTPKISATTSSTRTLLPVPDAVSWMPAQEPGRDGEGGRVRDEPQEESHASLFSSSRPPYA